MAQLSTIAPVVIYLALSFLAALWARKQSQKTSDSHGFIEEYFIGGRSMGGFVLAMSIIASYTSASSFVGGPGVAYKLGLSWVLLAMIQVPTTFLTLGVLGKRFAIMARKTRSVCGWSMCRSERRRMTSSSARWPCWSSSWRPCWPSSSEGRGSFRP